MATRVLRSPLIVGRDQHLELAERHVAEAAAGRGNAILVAGGAGYGKTRLLGAIMRKAQASRFRVCAGDLAPHDQHVPLASILGLARTMNNDRTFGTLGDELLALRGDEGADNLGSRRILVRRVAGLILDAVDRPTALKFDDLQWADELSLEVIGELARRGGEKPLLVVAAYRHDELPAGSIHREWRARLRSQRLAEEIRLDPLTRDETSLVVTLILGTGLPASREVVNAVYERTDGIPLHVEELLAALDDETLADGRAIRRAHVPDTIEDAVLARATRLSDEALAVARAGSVMGRCFVPSVLAGCMDLPVADLDAPLAELVEHGFLYPFEFLDAGYFDFRHQLLRDAIYGSVPPGELRRLHARAAEFGAQLAGANEVHASVHFERAGLRGQAFRAALAGARAASAVSSRREAFELYRRAVANLPDGLPAQEVAEVYEGYADAAMAVDDVLAIEGAATLARRWYLEAGNALDAASCLLMLASMARRDVRPVEAREAYLAQAEAELLALPDTPERALYLSDVVSFRASQARDAARLDEAARLFAEARRLRLASTDPNTADIDYMAAEADILQGRVQEGLDTMLEIARGARIERHEAIGVTAYRWAAAMAIQQQEYALAELGLREGLRYADEIEQSYCRHVLAATAAHLAWVEGRWDDAVTAASLELVEPGSRRGGLGSRDVLAFVAMGRGDVAHARELLAVSLEIGRFSGELDLLLPTLWGAAQTDLIAGDADACLARCEEAVTLTAQPGARHLLVPFVVTGTRAALLARRPADAERWLERLAGALHDWDQLARPPLDHATGLVRLATGSTGAARAALAAAVDGWDGRGRIWEATWARLDLAGCLVRMNRHADAVPLLRDVEATADRLGSTPLLERARTLLSRARSRSTDEEPWRPLTVREFEVARLVARGWTNHEIAEELAVAPRTVNAHLEHILGKLGVGRRAEVAAWVSAIDAGAGSTPETVAARR